MKDLSKTQPIILTKIENALKDIMPANRVPLRGYDLTETTDDPGNTELYLIYVPEMSTDDDNDDYLSIDWDAKAKDLQNKLQTETFTSEGDHSEQVTVLTQNTELLIILNFCK